MSKAPGKRIGFFALPLIALLLLAGSYFRILDNYELETLDIRFKLRPAIAVTDKIAIIEIGDDTIANLGRFPFDRNYHAALIRALAEAGAKAIVFDIFFSEPHADDEELEESMKVAGNVYLPEVFYLGEQRRNKITDASGYAAKELPELLSAAKGSGHINIIPDTDGKYRRVPLYVRHGEEIYPYLPFKVACDYLGIADKDITISPGRSVDIAARKINIPLDNRSNMIVNFAGKWGKSYKHYSYADILRFYAAKISGEKGEPEINLLKDKVCVIGLTAVGTSDLHPNPFESLYPAVGIYAELFNSILNNSYITRVSERVNIIILILLCLLVMVSTFLTKPLKGLAALFVIIILFIAASLAVFDVRGLWIDVAYPLFMAVLCYIFATLYKYISEWKKRIVMENELGIARQIQESFLPKEVPAAQGLEVAAKMFTARQVGGDLYDFTEFGDSKLGVMIGDVSGKGVPASLFMAMVTGAFRSFVVGGARPEEILSKLNAKLVKESASNLFVTVFCSIFDLKARTFAYANGGHLPVLRLSAGAKAEFLDVEEGAPLGLMDNNYSGKEIKFDKGDIFIFYTDGVTEAMNAKREMYEKERLVGIVQKSAHKNTEDILKDIEKDVRRFEPRSTQHDDITIIVVKIA